MAIVIQNISEQHDGTYGEGLQHYVLGINHNRFVEFTHPYQDGLSACLRAAANAFDELERSGKMKIYEREMMELILSEGKF